MKDPFNHYLSVENTEVSELYNQYLVDFENEAITFRDYLAARHVKILENICILIAVEK